MSDLQAIADRVEIEALRGGPVEDYNGPGRAMLVFERVLERTGVGILEV